MVRKVQIERHSCPHIVDNLKIKKPRGTIQTHMKRAARGETGKAERRKRNEKGEWKEKGRGGKEKKGEGKKKKKRNDRKATAPSQRKGSNDH